MTGQARKLLDKAKNFRRGSSGSIAAWTAFGIIGMVGAAAISIDFGYIYLVKNQLQGTADAAASAAVRQLPDASLALATAQDVATKNMPTATNGTVMASTDVLVGNWNGATRVFTHNGAPTNAIRVTARRDAANSNPVSTFFAKVLGIETVDVSAKSTALQKNFVAPCLLALDPTSDDAFTLDSNAIVDLTGCGVTINSNHATALTTKSNAEMAASGICIVGNYKQLGNSVITPPPSVACSPFPDPLAGLATPTVGSCTCTWPNGNCRHNLSSNSPWVTINPGVYCGGLEITSNSKIIMSPGVYVMKNGPFRADSNVQIQGDGVMIFLTGSGTNPGISNLGAVIDLDSNVIVDLSAPTSGPYADVLIFQDPALNPGGTHRINSNSNKLFEGVIYLKYGDVLVDSNGVIASTAPCTMIVARRFHFDSNAGITGTFDLNPGSTTCSVPIPAGLQSTTTSALVN
jgi:Flp pilus assembly protein TadG